MMSDDLIKRNSVIATIGRMYKVCTTGDITDYRDLMLESIKVLPSADRDEPKTDCDGCQHYSDEYTADVCYECKRSYTDCYVPQTERSE